MSNLNIRRVGNTQGEITVSTLRIGQFITAGRTEQVKIMFRDSDEIRLLSANLNDMKNKNVSAVQRIQFNDKQTYEMDQSVWHDLADALLAFAFCVDCESLGV